MAITTTGAVKDCLGGIQTGDDDGFIEGLIDRAAAYIDDQTGRQFDAASETRYFDPTDPEVVDGRFLYLDKDLVSVNTLTNGDADVLTVTTEYILQPYNDGPPYHTVQLIESGGITWTYDTDPEIAITILGSWGYSALAPTAISEACAALAAYYYRVRNDGTSLDSERTIISGGIVIAPAGIPDHVKSLIAPYKVKFQ